MNVLILNGSTRKKGNTNNSVKLIKDLLAKRGHTYTEINDNVIGCINCAQCIYDGKCHIEDSFSSDVQQNFDWILTKVIEKDDVISFANERDVRWLSFGFAKEFEKRYEKELKEKQAEELKKEFLKANIHNNIKKRDIDEER